MAAKFITFDRNSPMLWPPDLKDWVGEGDLVHFVIKAIDRLPLTCFKVNERGSGWKQHNPYMMLSLLVYKVDLYVSIHCEDAHKERQHDYRSPKKRTGTSKQAIGFRDFSVKAAAKIATKWGLVCASHSIRRLFNL